jgi:hypothetical protein
VWLQRPDASGARTPPQKQDLSEEAEEEERSVSSVSSSLQDSLGSLARRVHERTPPESEEDEDEDEKNPYHQMHHQHLHHHHHLHHPHQEQQQEEEEETDLTRPFGTRARSASVGDTTLRTPPGSPPGGRSFSPRLDTSSPFAERLFIPPDQGVPEKLPPRSLLLERSPIFASDMENLERSDGKSMPDFRRSDKTLGQGAFGKVWLGLRDNGEFLAIKGFLLLFFVVLDSQTKSLSCPEIQISQGDKYAERLEAVEKEIELMRNLDHPHIVRYLGSRRDLANSAFYILLEYVSCGSIQGLLKTMGGPLDERVIRKYSRQILLGLAYLHSRNPPVAHRDIKS